MKNGTEPATFAAIDVGSNAMRLKIVGLEPDGSIKSLFQQRAPVRRVTRSFSPVSSTKI